MQCTSAIGDGKKVLPGKIGSSKKVYMYLYGCYWQTQLEKLSQGRSTEKKHKWRILSLFFLQQRKQFLKALFKKYHYFLSPTNEMYAS